MKDASIAIRHPRGIISILQDPEMVWGDSGVPNDEHRHNSTNTHQKNAFSIGNSISGRGEAFATSPNAQKRQKKIGNAGFGPLRQFHYVMHMCFWACHTPSRPLPASGNFRILCRLPKGAM